jgi:hypothetical protein
MQVHIVGVCREIYIPFAFQGWDRFSNDTQKAIRVRVKTFPPGRFVRIFLHLQIMGMGEEIQSL